MKKIQQDLWETAVETPMPGLTTHAYLLIHDKGNVLFYNTGQRADMDHMAELGGVAWQYLSHRDELGDSILTLHKRFDTRLGGHILEQDEIARIRPPDILFEQRECHLGNIEVIPTPGHSPGSTCFLVHSPFGQRYLFTGDTLYRDSDGTWKAGFIPGYTREQDRDTLADSIRLLRTMEPDLVLSSAFAGSAGYQAMSPADWSGHVDRALAQLRE